MKTTTLIHHLFTLLIAILIPLSTSAQHEQQPPKTEEKPACHKQKTDKLPACCAAKGTAHKATTFQLGNMEVPNVNLVNQDGTPVNLHELIKDKVVAMNFIFTTCTTICPPMGANFSMLNRQMKDHIDENLVMISISLDPATDTPERLKAWRDKFQPEAGWTLLTGKKSDVENVLKGLNVFTPLKEEHAPILIMGKEGEDNWIRTNGLAPIDELSKKLKTYLPSSTPKATQVANETADRNYFTDTKLVNQHGEEFRLYTDLMKDKVVVINPFFAECQGSCPAMHGSLKEVQKAVGDKMGKEVVFLSITVDPEHDTPEVLKGYAESFEAKEGWHFLSGDPQNVEIVLQKLGNAVDFRENHKSIILMGNLPTRLWKKVDGLGPMDEIYTVLESVINDQK